MAQAENQNSTWVKAIRTAAQHGRLSHAVILTGEGDKVQAGSNITCGSWIPLMLLALVYDYRLAMMTGWVCGILVMILIPGWQAVHWAQIFVQQLVCFSCLGYAGVFGTDKRWKMLCGMALAVFIRCCGHVLSGVIFYSQNAWDGWGAWGYSLAYNLSSRLPEGVLSILIVLLLPIGLMRRTLRRKEGTV